MKASKFFKLKEEWEKAKQETTVESIAPILEKVKLEEKFVAPKVSKKKTLNEE
jgi:hypothetical protein